MTKKVRKLQLSFETLRHLQAPSLRRVAGGQTAPPEETENCGTGACATSECISYPGGPPCVDTNWSVLNPSCSYPYC